MGAYVNPKDGTTKEAFLAKYGTEVTREAVASWSYADLGELPVVLVDNGPFTAAGIAFCPQERDVFLRDGGGRPMRFYVVPTIALHKACADLSTYMARYLAAEAKR